MQASECIRLRHAEISDLCIREETQELLVLDRLSLYEKSINCVKPSERIFYLDIDDLVIYGDSWIGTYYPVLRCLELSPPTYEHIGIARIDGDVGGRDSWKCVEATIV